MSATDIVESLREDLRTLQQVQSGELGGTIIASTDTVVEKAVQPDGKAAFALENSI